MAADVVTGDAVAMAWGAAGTAGGGLGLVSALLCIVALGIYALTRPDAGNDDDDSSPGGGLMQPVA